MAEKTLYSKKQLAEIFREDNPKPEYKDKTDDEILAIAKILPGGEEWLTHLAPEPPPPPAPPGRIQQFKDLTVTAFKRMAEQGPGPGAREMETQDAQAAAAVARPAAPAIPTPAVDFNSLADAAKARLINSLPPKAEFTPEQIAATTINPVDIPKKQFISEPMAGELLPDTAGTMPARPAAALEQREAGLVQGERPGALKRALRTIIEGSPYGGTREKQIAAAQNAVNISRQTGLPPSFIKPSDQISFARELGAATQPTGRELLVDPAMTAAILYGGGQAAAAGKLAAYAGRTALTLGAFEGLNRAIPTDTFIPSDASSATSTAIELADFIVKGAMAGGIAGAIRPVGNFIKAKFAETPATKNIPAAVQDKIINSTLENLITRDTKEFGQTIPAPKIETSKEQVIKNAENRLAELNLKANGQEALEIKTPDGKIRQVKEVLSKFLTRSEMSERKFLTENINNAEKLADKYGLKIKTEIPPTIPEPKAAQKFPEEIAPLETIWTEPLEKLNARVAERNIKPPYWMTPEQIAADEAKYPGGEAYRKWAAEIEINSKRSGHQVPEQLIKKYGLEQAEIDAIDAERADKADTIKALKDRNAGSLTPALVVLRRGGGFNKRALLAWMGVREGGNWKGKEFPEEAGPWVRVKGGMSPEDFAKELYWQKVIPENDPALAMEVLRQNIALRAAEKAGKDITEFMPKVEDREWNEMGPDAPPMYSLKKPKSGDLAGQTFIPGSGPAMPTGKIRPAEFVDQEAWLDGFRAPAPEAKTPGLFDKPDEGPGMKPSGLSGRSWGTNMALEPVPGAKNVYKAQIRQFAEKAFNVPIYGRATIRMGDAVGKYFPRGRYIREVTWGELEVEAHEVAHAIGDTLFQNKFKGHFSEAAIKELRALDYDQRKRRPHEGFAEWFRYLMTTDQAETKAPAFTQEFKAKIAGTQIEKDIGTLKGMFTDWQGLGAVQRFKNQTDKKGETLPVVTAMDAVANKGREFYRAFVDKFDSFKIMDTQALKGDWWFKLTPYELLTRFAGKSGSIAKRWVMDEAVDLNGNKIGISLREALAPAMKMTPAGFVDKVEFENFMEYYIAKGVIERHARGLETGRDINDAKFIVEKFKSPEYDEAVKLRTEWEHNLYSLLLGNTYTPAELKAIQDIFEYHLSFRRAGKEALGGGSSSGGFLKPGKAVYRATGSGRPIINPFESDIANTQKIIEIAQKATVAQSLAEHAGYFPETFGRALRLVQAPQKAVTFTAAKLRSFLVSEGVDIADMNLDRMVTIFQTISGGKDNIIPIMVNGKRNFYEVDEQLWKDINKVGVPTLNAFTKVLRPFAQVKRIGATGLNFAFQLLRNPMKDWPTFMAYTKYTRNPATMIKDLAVGTYHGVNPDALAKRWENMGGEMSTFFGSNREGAFKAYDEILLESGKWPSKALLVAKHPIFATMGLLGTAEKGPRMAEFKGMYEKLTLEHPEWSEEVRVTRAFNASQDVTTNFSRSGTWGQQINQGAAFFNANVQGFDKMIREIKADPAKFLIMGSTLLTPPAIAAWYKNKDKEWYTNLPYAYRYGNIFVETDSAIYRVPQPFELGIIFQALPVAILDAAYRRDPEGFEGIWKLVGTQIPNPIPSVMGPVWNVATDSDYMGRPIEGERLKRLPMEDRVKPETMPIAIEISKAYNKLGKYFGVELSPVQVDFLLNDATGGFPRRTGLTGGNIKEAADLPVVGSIILREPFNPRLQLEKFFAERKELTELSNADRATPKQEARLSNLEAAYTYGLKPRLDAIKKARNAGDMKTVEMKYKEMRVRLDKLKRDAEK